MDLWFSSVSCASQRQTAHVAALKQRKRLACVHELVKGLFDDSDLLAEHKISDFRQETEKASSKPVSMNAPIVQIPESYNRYETETIRPSLSGLKSKEAVLIERFLAAQCNDAENRELVKFLLRHPEWICWISHRVNEDFETSFQHGRKGYFLRSAA